MIIVGIDDFQAEGLGVSGTFVLADVVLFERIDIGIAIVDDGGNAMLHQAFDDGRRAGGTTSMEEHFIGSSRDFYSKLLLHNLLMSSRAKRRI